MSDDATTDTLGARLRAAGVNPPGVVLVAIGVVLVLAAYSVLPWFHSGTGFFAGAGTRSTFGDLHSLLTTMRAATDHGPAAGHVHFSTSLPYFDWLAWVLLVVSLAAGALAVSAVGARMRIVRVLCAIIALSAVAATVFAVDLFAVDQRAGNATAPSFGNFLTNTSVGAWAAIAGYLLIVIACLLPRPRPIRF